jgi:type VI secretion system secreted protein VgrG
MAVTRIAEEDRSLAVEVEAGEALDVREFHVEERMSSLFAIELVVLSESPALDFDAILGQKARFRLRSGRAERMWSGIVSQLEQIRVEERGLSTYELTIVPAAWLLTQRRNYRMFQHVTEPDIALALLAEWGIEPDARIDRGAYKKRKYRVQYGESDHAFVSRMLEDAGISYFFADEGETRLTLSDAPQAADPRPGRLLFVDAPSPGAAPVEFVTAVRIGQRVRPGRYTMRDVDHRLAPTYPLVATASKGRGIEERLERYHYTPGAFLFGAERGDVTPAADDRGRTRSDEAEGARLAERRLQAKRGSARSCAFATNAHDLAPGRVIAVDGHPHPLLGAGKTLLVVASTLQGTSYGEWTHTCEARGADAPHRPPLVTPKPKAIGAESATVVGTPGEEIHTDEFGRVRVHFHWDRESRMNDLSSCWIPVSQSWGGAGYGGLNLPRVGQEVLVEFLGGDPDRPVIVGRMFTNLQKVPYKLPDNKTQSGWRSSSTGGSGGYNEIMFEDAAGQELLNLQAERDLQKLVKNDETVTIGNDRSKTVGRDDVLNVGSNRTKTVGGSERNVVGVNQSVSVGVNRATQVGRIDSTVVGEQFVVSVMPPGEYFLPAGSAFVSMVDGNITLNNGAGASIELAGDTVTISAGQINIKAGRNIDAFAAVKATLVSRDEATEIVSSKDVLIEGEMVRINP